MLAVGGLIVEQVFVFILAKTFLPSTCVSMPTTILCLNTQPHLLMLFFSLFFNRRCSVRIS